MANTIDGKTLPVEIEKLLLRPDVSNNVARTFSSAITPLIERNVKETIHKTLVPAYMEATTALQQETVHEIMDQVAQIKKEISNWQTESMKGTHVSRMNELRCESTERLCSAVEPYS